MKRVFAFVGFSAAITLTLLNTVDISYAPFILAVLVWALVMSMFIKPLRQAKTAPVVLGSAVFACLIFILSVHYSVMPQKALDGETAHAVFEITDIETENDSGYSYEVKTSSIDIDNAAQNIRLKLMSDTKINADYYQNIEATLSFYSFADNGFDSFGDYADNIFVRAKLIEYEPMDDESRPLNYYLIKLRLAIADIFENSLDSSKSGLALSILTGDTRTLSDDIYDSFETCGLTHLVAVSGMNISLISLCVYYVLKYLRFGRIVSTAGALISVIVYSGVAGYSKSVMRAAIMMTVVLVAKLINNKADTVNSLGLSVFLVCLNPFAVTDAGAALTVTAVIGLAVIKPEYDRLIKPKVSVFKILYDGLFASISVMLATVPVVWLFFGKISFISLFANIICIPMAEISMGAAMLLCFVFYIPVISEAVCFVLRFFIGALIETSDFFSSRFDFLYVSISDSVIGVAIAGIILLTGFSLIIKRKADIKLISLFAVLAFSLSAVFCAYDHYRNAYVTVFSSGAVAVYDRDAVLLIDFDDQSDAYSLESNTEFLSRDNAVALNSETCAASIEKIFDDAHFVQSKDLDQNICDHIYALAYTDYITVSVYNNTFKIDDDCVTINGYKVLRNVYDRFSSDGDVTFTVTKDAVIQIREE